MDLKFYQFVSNLGVFPCVFSALLRSVWEIFSHVVLLNVNLKSTLAAIFFSRLRAKNITLIYRHECFTGEYTTRKIHTKLHPGLEWRIFRILTSEDIDDFTDIKFAS